MTRSAILLLCLCFVVPALAAETTSAPADSIAASSRHKRTQVELPGKKKGKNQKEKAEQQPVRIVTLDGDTLSVASLDSVGKLKNVEILTDSITAPNLGRIKVFNPDPMRAMWLSTLFPGLGQIYNRRYWKLPIIVGAFVGLSYGTSWNNRMLSDYTKAYHDATDNDPNTRSYMNFYPPTVKEDDLDMDWLQRALKSKKDYFRRYRDICIFSMIGVYLLNVLDAYVDASLSHFDISPDLTVDVKPAVISNYSGGSSYTPSRLPGLGLQCAISF